MNLVQRRAQPLHFAQECLYLPKDLACIAARHDSAPMLFSQRAGKGGHPPPALTTPTRGVDMADYPIAAIEKNEQDALTAFEAAGHTPKLDEQGRPDEFALDLDPTENDSRGHNGFMCTVCDDMICVHCFAAGDETIQPCEGAG